MSDVARALRFYPEQVGFALDIDYAPTDPFRAAHLTPPGSSCSIQLGIGLTDAPQDQSATPTSLCQTSRPPSGVKIEEYDDPGFKTEDGIYDAGFATFAWITDPATNSLSLLQYK